MKNNDDAEILPGPLRAATNKEESEVQQYRPPSHHRIAFKRKMLRVEDWIFKNGLVYQSDVVTFIMQTWNMEREDANRLYKAVEIDLKRIGKVYGK